jgi:hypothetical protein
LAASASAKVKKLRTILLSVFGSAALFVVMCVTAACCRAHHKARTRSEGMYVIDQRGQGYWREKGALDRGFTYVNGDLPIKTPEPAFEDVHLTPVPSTGSRAIDMGTPASLIPGGKMRKGEFFTRLRNSISRKNRNRPFISKPVPISIPSHNATISRTVNSIQGSYINR